MQISLKHFIFCISIFSIVAGETPSSDLLSRFLELESKFVKLDNEVKTSLNSSCAPCTRKAGTDQCDCRNLEPKKDCLEFLQAGFKVNGLYKILGSKFTLHYAYCDQTTQGGGWTVIQRRKDGSETFFRKWNDYKNGFGDLESEFWYGNENIYDLTADLPKESSLLINMVMYGKSTPVHAKYDRFRIFDESLKYKLHVYGFSGNTVDNLAYHNGMSFSTVDQDNDESATNCASKNRGGWWYKNCGHSNLNGIYYFYDFFGCGKISWSSTCDVHPEFVEMKVRRNV